MIDDFFLGFAASYIAGNIPTIQSLINGNRSLSSKIEKCYDKAITRWCPNAEIRRTEYYHYDSLATLKDYLKSPESIDERIAQLFQFWAEEMRKDPECHGAIIELKSDILSAQMDDGIQRIMDAICKIQPAYKSYYDASLCLKNIRSTVGEQCHIDRKETEVLYDWLKKPVDEANQENIILLTGGPGEGKSVILHDLLIKLQAEGTKVLGIKSDLLFDSSDTDIDRKLNIGESVTTSIRQESEKSQVVLLVDQIDALSLTLSSNRKPLTILNTLINEVSCLPNVRVIVSCRPYDLEYDSSLERYRHLRKIQVKSLDGEQLSEVLRRNGYDTSILSQALLNLIATPQNLFLYLRLYDKAIDITSQNSLYHALWKEVINAIPGDVGTVEDAVEYLATLSDKLYDKQTLAINESLLGTKWSRIQTYLLTQGFLYRDDTSENIQFIHQTLYDYVFARLFSESGKTIENVFETGHQGLFVRPRLYQVLEYQRDVDIEVYIRNVKRILFKKSTNGEYLYRYQIRHLVLTSLAYHKNIYVEEEAFIKHQILESDLYIHLFVSSAQSKDAFSLIINNINKKGGFDNLLPEYKNETLDLISRLCVLYPEILEYLLSICKPDLDSASRNQIARIVNYSGVNIEDKSLEKLSDFIEENSDSIITYEYYERLCVARPAKVIKRICDIVEKQLKKESIKSAFEFYIDYQTKAVYDHLKSENKQKFINLCIKLLELLTSKGLGIIGEDIQTSRFYYTYNRSNTFLHFPETVLNDLLSGIESDAVLNEQRREIVSTSFRYAIDAFHIVGIVGCMTDIGFFSTTAFEYLEQNITKVHHSSSLDYYQKKLFEKVFMMLSFEQQKRLINVIGTLHPEWEKMPLRGTVFDTSPISRIGYTKAQYYHSIPEDYFKANFTEEYTFLIEMRRKFSDLENREPNSISSMTGWTTMEASAYDKMEKKDVLKSMETYNTNGHLDWSIPSKTGHAFALKEKAKDSPDFYYDIYTDAVKNPAIDLNYIIEGIEGLMNADYDRDKVDDLLNKLIERFDSDNINNNDRGDLIQTVRRSSYYVKKGIRIPVYFIDFICNVALNVTDERDEDKNVDINDGINQVRGAACDALVQCSYDESNTPQIFDTLEKIADTKPSVATRCSILFQIGSLLKYERNRVFDLVLRLTSDYNANLMRLPLHRLNPLLYLNNEEFSRFVNYFEAGISQSSTHEVITTLLLRAYLTGKEEGERLLLAYTDSSEISRCTLIREIKRYYNPLYHEKCFALLLKYMTFDEPELGRYYDDIFSILFEWESDVKEYVDRLVESPVCKYCNDEVYKFLEAEAVTNAYQCLKWLTFLYRLKRDLDDYNINVDKIVTILVSAYNSIRKFDKEDLVLEDAMDLLDDVLAKNVRYWNSIDCLNRFDTWKS